VAIVRLPVPGGLEGEDSADRAGGAGGAGSADRAGSADLRIRELFSEPRGVLLASGHRLADRARIDAAELRDESFVAAPAQTGAWRDYWLGGNEVSGPDGPPVRIGAVTTRPDEWLVAIGNGDGVALAPESAARFYLRPGIVFRPVDGISASTVAVAWRVGEDADPVVQDFVACCLDVTGEDREDRE